jgi:hypothetical protein
MPFPSTFTIGRFDPGQIDARQKPEGFGSRGSRRGRGKLIIAHEIMKSCANLVDSAAAAAV